MAAVYSYVKLSSIVTTSVAIQNMLSKAAVTHSESNTTRGQWVCLEAEPLLSTQGLFWDEALGKCSYKKKSTNCLDMVGYVYIIM